MRLEGHYLLKNKQTSCVLKHVTINMYYFYNLAWMKVRGIDKSKKREELEGGYGHVCGTEESWQR